jgi:hypothetical protein
LRRLRAEWGEYLTDSFLNRAFSRATLPFIRLTL